MILSTEPESVRTPAATQVSLEKDANTQCTSPGYRPRDHIRLCHRGLGLISLACHFGLGRAGLAARTLLSALVPSSRLTVTALLAVAITAITACGSNAPSSSASSYGTAASPHGSTLGLPGSPCPVPAPASQAAGDPLAGLTVAQIRAKAGADTEAMKSVCMSVRQPLPGTRLKGLATVTVASLSAPGRCESAATTSGGGSATLLEAKETLWVRANQAYARIAGAQTAEALSARTGKWVHAQRTDATIDNLLSLCGIPWPSFSNLTLPDKSPSFTETRIAGLPVIDGQRTVGITDPLGDTTYVSDTARPLPVRDVFKDLPGITLDYFDFGIPATITPPPAADVIDGSGYGFQA